MAVDPQFSAILPRLPMALALARGIAEGKFRPEDIPPMPMPPPTPIAFVEDRTVPPPSGPIPLRIYAPRRGAPLPLVLFFHGGGFISGDLATHDELCRRLAIAADCVIVAVAYRLAPAHPYPAALHDCLAALDWAVRNAGEFGADAARLAVAGDSAGGNLAAVITLHVRDKGGPRISAQLLIYPGTDMTAPKTGSLAETGEGFYMSEDDLEFFTRSYVGQSDPADPFISPLRAESLARLPPAFVLTAEHDQLRDQGQAYAAALAAAGVATDYVNYEGAIHGFLTFPVPMSASAIAECADWLRNRLG